MATNNILQGPYPTISNHKQMGYILFLLPKAIAQLIFCPLTLGVYVTVHKQVELHLRLRLLCFSRSSNMCEAAARLCYRSHFFLGFSLVMSKHALSVSILSMKLALGFHIPSKLVPFFPISILTRNIFESRISNKSATCSSKCQKHACSACKICQPLRRRCLR
jgi:hypothetical protein